MFGISFTNWLPAPLRSGANQANSFLSAGKGQQLKQYGTTMIAQQMSGKKDGLLMNSIQAASPKWYNAIRLTKGNLFHLPVALFFPERYFAYRLAKESNQGVTKLNTLGILFAPNATALWQIGGHLKSGKLKPIVNPLD